MPSRKCPSIFWRVITSRTETPVWQMAFSRPAGPPPPAAIQEGFLPNPTHSRIRVRSDRPDGDHCSHRPANTSSVVFS